MGNTHTIDTNIKIEWKGNPATWTAKCICGADAKVKDHRGAGFECREVRKAQAAERLADASSRTPAQINRRVESERRRHGAPDMQDMAEDMGDYLHQARR